MAERKPRKSNRRLDDLQIRVGEALRRAREERGMSLADVSAAVGGAIPRNTISNYENGNTPIPAHRLIVLCEDALEMSAAELLRQFDTRNEWPTPLLHEPQFIEFAKFLSKRSSRKRRAIFRLISDFIQIADTKREERSTDGTV